MGIFVGTEFYFPEYILNSKIIFLISVIVYLIFAFKLYQKNRLTIINGITYFLFIFYVAILISITLFPVNIYLADSPIYLLGFGKQLLFNFSIYDLANYSNNKTQILGNIALLIPLTFFLSLINPKYSNYKSAFLWGFIISFIIESLQALMSFFYLGSRISDINDILLNSVGALIGVLFYKIFYHFFNEQIDSIHY